MTTNVDPHVQALRDLLLADHRAYIAERQRLADAAAARGDEWMRKLHQDCVDREKAIRFRWEDEAG